MDSVGQGYLAQFPGLGRVAIETVWRPNVREKSTLTATRAIDDDRVENGHSPGVVNPRGRIPDYLSTRIVNGRAYRSPKVSKLRARLLSHKALRRSGPTPAENA